MKFLTKRNRAILREMVGTDFKLRYQGSILGYLWSFMRPFLMFLVLFVIFAKFLKVGEGLPNFPIYLLLGIVLWTFFSEVTSRGLTVIVERGDLIRKISIPRYLLVLSTSFSATINLVLNLLVVATFAFFSSVDIQANLLWLIPILVLELFLLGVSLAFILSALYVKIRDTSYLWEVLIQAGFYATPILYPIQRVPEEVKEFLLLSPVAQIIQDFREILVTNQTIRTWDVIAGPGRLVPIATVIILAISSVYYFRSAQKTFAEDL